MKLGCRWRPEELTELKDTGEMGRDMADLPEEASITRYTSCIVRRIVGVLEYPTPYFSYLPDVYE